MRDLVYYFVIDTDAYAGNFEREMCAYLTGVVGDCGTGHETARAFRKQFPDNHFDENVIKYFDDNGCYRPCEVYPTPGRFNHGSGKHYDDDADMTEVQADFIAKQEAYYASLIELAEQNIADGKIEWTRDLAGFRKRIEEVKTQEIQKYPAFESVAIAFKCKPSDEDIEFLKHRAHEFVADKELLMRKYISDVNIRGFRLIECKTTYTEHKI